MSCWLSDILGSEVDAVTREMESEEEKRIVREAVDELNDRGKGHNRNAFRT